MAARRYLITGDAGSGKSSLAAYLQNHGYNAIDTDHNELSHWVERTTGKSFASRPMKDIGWENMFDWMWREETLKQLLSSKRNALLFLCGVSHNQSAFYHLFDKIFLLSLDLATLKARLLARTTSSFGKQTSELKAVREWHDEFEHNVLAAGAIAIDASQPIDKVAAEILSHLTQ